MDTEKIFQERIQRVRKEMERIKVDTLVLFKAQNTFYITNFNAIIYSRPVIVTLPLDQEPCLIVPRLRWDHAKKESRVKDVKVYHKTKMSRAPAKMASDPLILLKEVLEEKNATKGNIGIERDYLTVTIFDELRKILPNANFVDIADSFQRLRLVKDAEEIKMVRRAAEISDVGIKTAINTISEGTTEIEVSVRAMNTMNEYWKERYPDSEVCGFGDTEGWTINGLTCYCIPGTGLYGCDSPSSRKLRKGDNPFVVVQTIVNGYHCENERTPIIGEPTPEQRRVIKAHFEATKTIEETIRPGVTCYEVAEAGAKVYEKYGYAEYAGARAGHSMGLSGHEGPSFALGEKRVLQKNMVMSVEPSLVVKGIHVGNSNVGMVTEDGFEILTKYRLNELIVL